MQLIAFHCPKGPGPEGAERKGGMDSSASYGIIRYVTVPPCALCLLCGAGDEDAHEHHLRSTVRTDTSAFYGI